MTDQTTAGLILNVFLTGMACGATIMLGIQMWMTWP